MKHKTDRPENIVKANTPSCKKKCKKEKQKLLYDDYSEELNEYAMDAPGSYQGASVWGGTGNYGLGGTKQISGKKLNKATQRMDSLEQNLKMAQQKDDSEYEDDYSDWMLDRLEDKFLQHIQAEAYPMMSTKPGTGTTFANLPGYPRPNTLSKKQEFIPDDSENEESEAMADAESDWLDHIFSTPQPWEKASKLAQMAAIKQGGGPEGYKTNPKPAAPKNTNTPSNGLGYAALASPKKYVPDEIDQYRDDAKDIIWKIGKENIF